MKKATILVFSLLLFSSISWAQETEFLLELPVSEDFKSPYSATIHSGARAVAGPVDLDGDGQMEVLVSDYTGGGRVHVVENTGVDTWEHVYSTPWVDSTASTENIRAIGGGDLDNDGMGEILFLAGRVYAEGSDLRPGLYAYEFNGTDFGTAPTSVYEFPDHLPDRWRVEQIAVDDFDGDDRDEIMFGNNTAANANDNWYIIGVNGDIGSGFEVWVEEARLSSRASDEFDPVNRGGGSPYAIHAGDFDGDGVTDLSLHSWNNFNFTTGRVLGANQYEFPDSNAANVYYRGSASDDVSFFGGVVVDIDGDGNDEVFYPNLNNGDVSLLNYDAGENTLEITADNFVTDLIPGLSSLGIGAGDLDGDGNMEVYGSGPSYSVSRYENGQPPAWIRIAEFSGGDPENPANYQIYDLEAFAPSDTVGVQFDEIIRDSAGVITRYHEETAFTGKDRAGGIGGQGPVFVSKMAYLGDVDGDGFGELALAFQGVDDSTYVIRETFNPADSTYTREIVERRVNENRAFLRIIEGSGFSVAVEHDVVLPSDYRLSANYPNPFNPATTFSFTLPVDKRVSVRVYDVTGRLVKTLVDGQQFARGTYDVTWDGTNAAGAAVASGTYVYSLEYGSFRQSRTMVLVK